MGVKSVLSIRRPFLCFCLVLAGRVKDVFTKDLSSLYACRLLVRQTANFRARLFKVDAVMFAVISTLWQMCLQIRWCFMSI